MIFFFCLQPAPEVASQSVGCCHITKLLKWQVQLQPRKEEEVLEVTATKAKTSRDSQTSQLI